jgi:hypothetical protein
MARQQKSQSMTAWAGPALKAAVICSFIVACCVGYVWEKQQINVLAEQYGKKEARLAELRNQNDKLKRQLAALLSPAALDQRVKDLKLGLGPPQPMQIWWLPEPADRMATPKPELRYLAASSSPSVNAMLK